MGKHKRGWPLPDSHDFKMSSLEMPKLKMSMEKYICINLKDTPERERFWVWLFSMHSEGSFDLQMSIFRDVHKMGISESAFWVMWERICIQREREREKKWREEGEKERQGWSGHKKRKSEEKRVKNKDTVIATGLQLKPGKEKQTGALTGFVNLADTRQTAATLRWLSQVHHLWKVRIHWDKWRFLQAWAGCHLSVVPPCCSMEQGTAAEIMGLVLRLHPSVWCATQTGSLSKSWHCLIHNGTKYRHKNAGWILWHGTTIHGQTVCTTYQTAN